MREILFKAKELDSQEWVIGSLVKLSEYDYRIVSESDVYWAYTGYGDYEGTMTKIDSNTICQYTGLTDKNGNKIWENDIIQLEDRICHIYWFDKNAQFDCKFIKHNKDIVITNFKGVEPREYEDYEVIGNIFDNTEWLGEQNG